jgi:hypothetical protein
MLDPAIALLKHIDPPPLKCSTLMYVNEHWSPLKLPVTAPSAARV